MFSQEEANSVAQELRSRILEYKKKKPSLSSHEIAKNFGIPASTFNRIENLDIKTPSFEQIVKVLSATGNDEDLIKYLDKKFPQMTRMMAQKYATLGNTKIMKAEMQDALTNPRYSKIVTLILCKKWTDKKYIKDMFGLDGLLIIDELKEMNIVKESDGGQLIITSILQHARSIKDTRDLFIEALKTSFDCSEAEKNSGENLISFQAHAVNAKKAIPILNEKLSNVYHTFFDMINDPEFKGDDVVFLGMVADHIVPKRIREQYELNTKSENND